jgi:hypothetical protein
MKLAWNHPVSSRNELKTRENGLGGRKGLDFGTVRPRVQIPGPRPTVPFRTRDLLSQLNVVAMMSCCSNPNQLPARMWPFRAALAPST